MSIPLGMRIALILSPLANPYWDHSKYARFPGRKEVEWYDGSGRQKGQLSRVPRLVLGFNRLQEEFLPTEDYVYGRMYLTPIGVLIPERHHRTRDNSLYLKGVEWLITNRKAWPMDNVEIILTYQFALVLINEEIFQ